VDAAASLAPARSDARLFVVSRCLARPSPHALHVARKAAHIPGAGHLFLDGGDEFL
jgi:hypothetical protein